MKRPTAPREAQVEKVFHHLVRSELAGITWKLEPTTAGIPDRLVMLPGGVFFLVELKTETGRLSEIQVHMHDRLWRQLGIRVVVLYGAGSVREWVRSQRYVGDEGVDVSLNLPAGRAFCPSCDKEVKIRKDGLIRAHQTGSVRCAGSETLPLESKDIR